MGAAAGLSDAPSLGPSATGTWASGEPAGVGATEVSDPGDGAAEFGASAVEGPDAGEPLGAAEIWLGEGAEASGDEAGEGEEALGDGEAVGELEGEGEGAEADTDPTTARAARATTMISRAIFFTYILFLVCSEYLVSAR